MVFMGDEGNVCTAAHTVVDQEVANIYSADAMDIEIYIYP